MVWITPEAGKRGFYTLNQLRDRQNHSNRCTAYFIYCRDFNHVLIRGDDVRIMYGDDYIFRFFDIRIRLVQGAFPRWFTPGPTLYIISRFNRFRHFKHRAIYQACSPLFFSFNLFKYCLTSIL